MPIDNAAIARQLGYSREEMIAKFGNPGEKTPAEIGNMLGLDSSTVTSIFGTPQNADSSTDYSGWGINDIIDDSVANIDHAAIAQQLGYSKEEMIAKFGNPGEKTPAEIGNILGLDNSTITNIFGTFDKTEVDSSSNDNSKKEEVDSFIKTQDDKYEEVANALGYDALSVSAVMKYLENGNVTGAPENVVPQVAKDLGLPETFVSNVLSYLNNGQI